MKDKLGVCCNNPGKVRQWLGCRKSNDEGREWESSGYVLRAEITRRLINGYEMQKSRF